MRCHRRDHGLGIGRRVRLAGRLRARAHGRGADRRRALRAPAPGVAPLRRPADRGRRRLVRRQLLVLRRPGALQHRPCRRLAGRGRPGLSRARVPVRRARTRGPRAGPRDGAGRRVALPPDCPARGALSDPVAVGRVRRRLPRQRVHAARLRAGVRRERRAPDPGAAHRADLRGGDATAGLADRACQPPAAALADARAGRCDLPACSPRGGNRSAPARACLARRRGADLGDRACAPGTCDRVPRRARPLAAVHRRGDGAARDAAARAPRSRRPARRARRRVRRPDARGRLLARASREGHWADADGGAVDLPPPGSGRAVTETARRRAARRGDRPRPGAGARPRVRRRRHVVRVDHARQPSPRGPDVGAPDRGAGVARPHPGGGGPGAAADRARPARRGPATARDAADQAGARRGAVRRRERHRRRAAAGARPRGRRGARRGAIAGARHLSRAAGVARPRRGAARGRAADGAAGRRSWQPASSATRARSSAPRTSAASRRCRTPTSTPRARPRPSS